MRYHVCGARRDTGEDAVIDIYASDPDQAVSMANARGILPSEVTPMPTATELPTPSPASADASEDGLLDAVRSIRRAAVGVAAVGILGVLVGIVGVAGLFRGSPTPSQKWEYVCLAIPDSSFDQNMTDLGAVGWELVSARRASSVGGTYWEYEVILKRPAR